MTMTTQLSRSVGMVVGFILTLILAGCDYWPPALQAQIEQMRSETQTLTMEKTQLQGQVSDLSNARQELQSQVDEMTRMNREKSAMIMSLQQQLDTVRAKALKSMSSKTIQRKVGAKSMVKPSSKAAPTRAPKAPTKKSVSKGIGAR